ncbi:hypothetical protein EJB05_51663, partial [Eragrostis curvula]
GQVVCEICGSGGHPPVIAKCVQCSCYQHQYCIKKRVSSNEGNISSQIQAKNREEPLCTSVDVTGSQSEASSPFNNIKTLLIMDSTAVNPRRPSSENCWT